MLCNIPKFRLPAGIFLITAVFYMAFTPPYPYWLDAPEFVAAGFSLGLVHPPGHPLVMLLLKLFDLLPIGDIAFRSNLFSGVFAALSASMLGLLTFCVVRQLEISQTWSEILAWMAGIGFGLSPAMVTQGTGVEVYSLNAFLVLTALYLALHKRPATVILSAFIIGLGVANHHYLTILIIPAVLMAAWPVIKKRPHQFYASVVASMLPLALYLYLPVRAGPSVLPAWTSPYGAGLFNYVSARTFAGSIGGFSMAQVAQNLQNAMFMIFDQVSPLYFLIALLGAWVLFTKQHKITLILLTFFTLDLMSKIMMSVLDPQNPDAFGYFLPAFAMVFLFGVLATLPLIKTRARIITAGFGLGLVVIPLILSIKPALNRRGFHDTHTYTRLALQQVPNESIVMESFYPTFFLTLYDRIVEGLRPDSLYVQASFYEKSGGQRLYVQQLCQGHDLGLCPVARNFLLTKSIDWGSLLSLSRSTPLLFEPESGLEGQLSTLTYRGFYFQAGHGGAIHIRDFISAQHKAFKAPARMDMETKRILLRLYYLSAKIFIYGHNKTAAKYLLQECLRLNPYDTTVKALSKDVSIRFY